MSFKVYEVRVSESGRKEWWLNGTLHREDGPAIELADGSTEWYFNGKVHREDGPAIERQNGSKSWWRSGKLHREDGPAGVLADGSKEWYLEGEPMTMSEHADKTRPAKEMTVAEIEKLLGYRIKIVK